MASQPGWRLWLIFSLASVLGAELIVSAMSWLLQGAITLDYLLTGLVAAGCVAPASLAVLTRMLEDHRQFKEHLMAFEGLRVQKNLQLSLDGAHLVFWELDLVSKHISFDESRLHWLGLAPDLMLHTLDDWLALVHADDRLAVVDSLGQPVESMDGKGHEYRLLCPDGSCVWHRTFSRIAQRDATGRPVLLTGVTFNITQSKVAEQALQASEARANRLATMLRLVSDNVPDMIWAKDLNKNYLFANKAMCEQLLGAASTDEPVGRNDLFFAYRARALQPDKPLWHTFGECCQDTDEQTLRHGKPLRFEETGFVRGQSVSLDVHKAPLLDDHGQLIGTVGSARDVTAQKAVQDKLRLASLVLDHSSEAMLATDADNHIVDVNPAFTTLTGYTRDEVLGKTPAVLQSGRQSEDFYLAMWRDLETKGRWQGELWNKRKNGEIYAEWLTVNTIYHDDGSVNRRVALFSDVTEKKQAQDLIWKQANFDALTGLPNRRMFHDRLAQDLIKAHRGGLRVAVFFLDLDHFKEVNDTLGHDMGDVLLVETGRRISACVRASDTVARLGGDEFTVILPELDDLTRVKDIASSINQSLAQVFELDGHSAHVSASIGITLYPDDAISAEALMQNVDRAMYEAKRAGRGRFCFYEPSPID